MKTTKAKHPEDEIEKVGAGGEVGQGQSGVPLHKPHGHRDAELGPRQLGAQLLDPELDLLAGAAATDGGGLVSGDPHLAGAAQLLQRHGLQGEAGVLGQHLAATDRRDVLQLVHDRLRESPEMPMDRQT